VPLFRDVAAPAVAVLGDPAFGESALLLLVLLLLLRRVDLLLHELVLGLQEVQLLQLKDLVSQDSILGVSLRRARVSVREPHELVVQEQQIAAQQVLVVRAVQTRARLGGQLRAQAAHVFGLHASEAAFSEALGGGLGGRGGGGARVQALFALGAGGRQAEQLRK